MDAFGLYFGALPVDEVKEYHVARGQLCVDFMIGGYGFYGFPAEYLDVRND